MTCNIATRLAHLAVSNLSRCVCPRVGRALRGLARLRRLWSTRHLALGDPCSAPPPRTLFCLASFLGLAYLAALEVLGRFVELGGPSAGVLGPREPASRTSHLPSCAAHSFSGVRALTALPALRSWCVAGSARGGICAPRMQSQHRDMGLETCTDRQCCSPTAAWRLSVG